MTAPEPPRPRSVSYDALVDDLVGLNWRALKTLWWSVTQPKAYSRAAWHDDWQNRYTPSFRVWFTLVAILFFFQFFWAADDSALIALFASQIERSGALLSEGVTSLDASRFFARVNFSILPIVSALCLFLLGCLWRAWGEPVPIVVRIRYVFAVVIPSTALTLPFFWFLGNAQAESALFYVIVSWLIPPPIDAMMAGRGPLASLRGLARWWRAVALSGGILAAMYASALISMFLSVQYIHWRFPP
ncbi:MAG: hypothetical protein AAF465_10365 [Pseudomonadota bacterium]